MVCFCDKNLTHTFWHQCYLAYHCSLFCLLLVTRLCNRIPLYWEWAAAPYVPISRSLFPHLGQCLSPVSPSVSRSLSRSRISFWYPQILTIRPRITVQRPGPISRLFIVLSYPDLASIPALSTKSRSRIKFQPPAHRFRVTEPHAIPVDHPHISLSLYPVSAPSLLIVSRARSSP